MTSAHIARNLISIHGPDTNLNVRFDTLSTRHLYSLVSFGTFIVLREIPGLDERMQKTSFKSIFVHNLSAIVFECCVNTNVTIRTNNNKNFNKLMRQLNKPYANSVLILIFRG